MSINLFITATPLRVSRNVCFSISRPNVLFHPGMEYCLVLPCPLLLRSLVFLLSFCYVSWRNAFPVSSKICSELGSAKMADKPTPSVDRLCASQDSRKMSRDPRTEQSYSSTKGEDPVDAGAPPLGKQQIWD